MALELFARRVPSLAEAPIRAERREFSKFRGTAGDKTVIAMTGTGDRAG